jgi:hypothetical protein
MPTDSVLDVKERVSSLANTLAFPDSQLLLKGKALDGSQNLYACGVVEDEIMEFLYEASEQTLANQLSDLLGEHSVPLEELGLMYIHRHGTSIDEVLKQLGYVGEKLSTFLENHKCFSIGSGRVKLVKVIESDAMPVTTSTVIEVKISVQLSSPSKPCLCSFDDDDEECDQASLRLETSSTVANAKKVIAAAELVPFSELDLLVGDRKLVDELSLNEAGVKSGDSLVLAVRASEATLVSQLEELLRERAALSPNELSLLYCQRFGTPACQALRMLGQHSNIRRFLERHHVFSISGGCVTLRDGSVHVAADASS